MRSSPLERLAVCLDAHNLEGYTSWSGRSLRDDYRRSTRPSMRRCVSSPNTSSSLAVPSNYLELLAFSLTYDLANNERKTRRLSRQVSRLE